MEEGSSPVSGVSGPPIASSPDVRSRLARQARRDTVPELRLRKALHRQGVRYFVDRPPLPNLRRRADIVFPRRRLAVFVDGCFWHCCPRHSNMPTNNRLFWENKLTANRLRDRLVTKALRKQGWLVVRIWEHDLSKGAVPQIRKIKSFLSLLDSAPT